MWSTHDGIDALRREPRELASSLPAATQGNQHGGSQLKPVMLAQGFSLQSREESVLVVYDTPLMVFLL